MNSFFIFDHKCEKMPEDIYFFQQYNEDFSRFEARYFDKEHKLLSTAMLYNFNYCPYCGENINSMMKEEK